MTAADNNDDFLVQTIFLVIIATLCLGVSWWSMTEGYKSFFGSYLLAATVSTVFVLMMAALNYALRRGLAKGIGAAKVVAILVMYLLVVILSFSGMFNKFYSQFAGNDLVREEINQKIDLLNDLKNRAMIVLTNEEREAIIVRVEQLKGDMEREVLTRRDEGFGTVARGILADIQKELGRTSPFREPPLEANPSVDELKEAIERVKADIDSEREKSERLRTLHEPEKVALAQSLPIAIESGVSALESARSKFGSIRNASAQADGLAAIQKAVDIYKEQAAAVAALVKEGEGFVYDKTVRVVNDRIGEVPHAYESALSRLDRGAVWVAALIAIGIDLVVPLFVFFLTPRSGVSRRTGSRRGPSGLKAEH